MLQKYSNQTAIQSNTHPSSFNYTEKSQAEVVGNEQVEIKQLPIKAYLDQNLMPLLLEALTELSKQKPEEPIEFVAKYLLEHNPEKNWGNVKAIWRYEISAKQIRIIHACHWSM